MLNLCQDSASIRIAFGPWAVITQHHASKLRLTAKVLIALRKMKPTKNPSLPKWNRSFTELNVPTEPPWGRINMEDFKEYVFTICTLQCGDPYALINLLKRKHVLVNKRMTSQLTQIWVTHHIDNQKFCAFLFVTQKRGMESVLNKFWKKLFHLDFDMPQCPIDLAIHVMHGLTHWKMLDHADKMTNVLLSICPQVQCHEKNYFDEWNICVCWSLRKQNGWPGERHL